MNDSKWILPKSEIEDLKKDKRLFGMSDISLNILSNRGINDPEDILAFMHNGLPNLHDTRLMKDAELAVSILIESIKLKHTVIVYTDFDNDGVCGAGVAVGLLRNLGMKANFYTNNRFIHGYGMCKEGVDELLEKFPECKVVMTVDNGIMAHEAIIYAKSKGLIVIVTDHHEQGDTLPLADAIVNPKRRDDEYPFKGLCGAGVVFKLMLLLYWELGEKISKVYEYLDIVAMATVGDVMPIMEENRIIVREGLRLINQEKRNIFKLFREVTELKSNVNSHYVLGFIYVPMINAIGRLDGNPERAIEMFLNDDEVSGRDTLIYLKEINERRKKITVEQCEDAEKILESKGIKSVIVIYSENFHEGIVGLIAGRLKEKYNRPTIILTKNGDHLKGSARSIEGLHLKEAFDAISPLLRGYGGHSKAAGLSLMESNLDEFEKAIVEIADNTLKSEDFIKKYKIDYVIDAKTVNQSIIDELKELEPFGEAFPKPLLLLDNFESDKPFYMGEGGKHVKLSSPNISIIMWNEAENYKENGEPQKIKALGNPDINIFRGKVSLQFKVNGDNYRY